MNFIQTCNECLQLHRNHECSGCFGFFFFKWLLLYLSNSTKEEEGERLVELFLAQVFSAAQAVLFYVHGVFRVQGARNIANYMPALINSSWTREAFLSWKSLTNRDNSTIRGKLIVRKSDLGTFSVARSFSCVPLLSHLHQLLWRAKTQLENPI